MKNGNVDVVICPPCGEQPLAPEGFNPGVALATKRGANKVSPILPLLPRLTAVLPPQGREITTRGFTLIELLVVVLIIGILAAVAVPQYQVAVKKAQVAHVLARLASIEKAVDVYKLGGGDNITLANLDIDLPLVACKGVSLGDGSPVIACDDNNFEYAVWGGGTNSESRIQAEDLNTPLDGWLGYIRIDKLTSGGGKFYQKVLQAAGGEGKWAKVCWYESKLWKAVCKSLEGTGFVALTNEDIQ